MKSWSHAAAKASAPIYPFVLSWSLKDVAHTERERETHGSGMSDTTGLLFPQKDGQMEYLGADWSSFCRLQLALGLCVAQQYLPEQHFFLLVSSAPILPLLNGGIFHFFHNTYISEYGCSCAAFVSCSCDHFWRRESQHYSISAVASSARRQSIWSLGTAGIANRITKPFKWLFMILNNVNRCAVLLCLLCT